ncbi:hypothetical protein [Nonomuraea sp. NPDC003201]
MSFPTDLAQHAAVFQPGDPPRSGHVTFLDPDGPSAVTVAEEHDGTMRTREVAATLVPVGEAVAGLARARMDPRAHPATRFWGAAALVALQLVTRGRILPGVRSRCGAWRRSRRRRDPCRRC